MTVLTYCLVFFLIVAIGAVEWLRRTNKRKVELSILNTNEQVAEVRAQLSDLSAEWNEQKHELWKPVMPTNGFNLNRRPDALRRLRAGHRPEHVANGTGWSACEVELLKKVEGLNRVRSIA